MELGKVRWRLSHHSRHRLKSGDIRFCYRSEFARQAPREYLPPVQLHVIMASAEIDLAFHVPELDFTNDALPPGLSPSRRAHGAVCYWAFAEACHFSTP